MKFISLEHIDQCYQRQDNQRFVFDNIMQWEAHSTAYALLLLEGKKKPNQNFNLIYAFRFNCQFSGKDRN